MISIKSKKEISLMREAGLVAVETLEKIQRSLREGVTTGEIDKIAYDCITGYRMTPSFYHYRGFPGSVCASVNEVVIHGIPGARRLREGDIISIDIGVCNSGYHADCARTFGVGTISPGAARLIEVTEQSFYEGIAFAKAGERLSNISHAVQTYAESYGYGVVRDFVGHGVGSQLHEDPSIPNYGPPGRGVRLYPGMTLAVEPMISQGTYQVKVLEDGWTTVTADRSLAAHYENTILVTEQDPVILTK